MWVLNLLLGPKETTLVQDLRSFLTPEYNLTGLQDWFSPSVICLIKCTFLRLDTLPKSIWIFWEYPDQNWYPEKTTFVRHINSKFLEVNHSWGLAKGRLGKYCLAKGRLEDHILPGSQKTPESSMRVKDVLIGNNTNSQTCWEIFSIWVFEIEKLYQKLPTLLMGSYQ